MNKLTRDVEGRGRGLFQDAGYGLGKRIKSIGSQVASNRVYPAYR